MSRFQAARANFREKIFGSGTNEATPGASSTSTSSASASAEDTTDDEDTSRRERSLKQLLSHGRKKFIERGIEGSIEVSSCVTIFTHSVSCDVNPESSDGQESMEGSSEGEAEEISRANAAAISVMDRTITQLQKRASAYRGTSFRDDVTLSSGVYVTMPFFGLASISITFTATVKSLLKV